MSDTSADARDTGKQDPGPQPGRLWVPSKGDTYRATSPLTDTVRTITEVTHVEFTAHHVVFHGSDGTILALHSDLVSELTQIKPDEETKP